MALSAKKQRFVDEYLIDLNATQAAVRAGYSKRSAHSQGPRLLDDAGVAAAIEAGKAALAERTAVSAEKVIAELARVAFARAGEFFRWDDVDGVKLIDRDKLTPDQVAAISEISETTTQHGGTIRLKLHDKVEALTLLGKHIGLFADQVNLGGKVTLENKDAIPRPQTYDDWLRYQAAYEQSLEPAKGNGHAGG